MIRLTEKQIKDKIKFLNEYKSAKNAASGSKVDANANVSCKNIATMAAEMNKDIGVQINRTIMKEKISDLFGQELGEEYVRQLENHEIYHHDQSSSVPMPYCVSISIYPFLLNGLQDLGGESTVPKNLYSFCGSFINLVFALSAQFAGAVAVPEFLMTFNHFAKKQYGNDYLNTNRKEIEQHIQGIIFSLNQPAAARSYQSVFINFAIFDRYYFESIFGNFSFPDGEVPNYDEVDKLQRFFMTWFNNERTKALLTFPVMTAAILSENDKPKDLSFSNFLAKELAEGNSFFIYNSKNADSLSSCCRLLNEITDNTFSPTLGSAGVATGSKCVITLNMNSLFQEKRDLKTEIEKIQKYLIAYNAILQEFYDNDLLPVYKAGFISFKKQFSTIGINGILEAAEYLGYEISNNKEYKQFLIDNLKIIYDSNKEANKKYGVMFNAEQIPGENLGVKNAMWDRKKGLKVNRDCYNSYFYKVEDDTISIVDKFILHGGDIVKWLDGGSALHLNLEEYPTQEAYLKLIELAIKTGCNYFTTNVKITICNSCGCIDKRTLNKCPKCGSHDIDYAVRIIGYLKRISSFSEARQLEASKRIYHKNNT